MQDHNQGDDEQHFEMEVQSVSIEPILAHPNEDDAPASTTESRSFFQFGKRFETVLQMLWKYMHEIGPVAETTATTNLATLYALVKEILEAQKSPGPNAKELAKIKLVGKTKENNPEDAKEKTLECKVYSREHLRKIGEFQHCFSAAKRILHESAVQQVVNAWERLLADLLEWRLQAKPEDIASQDDHISYKDLLSYESLEDAQNEIIDRTISSILRGGTREHLKSFTVVPQDTVERRSVCG